MRVRDRSRSIGKTVRAISKTLARRTGEATAQVMSLNEQAGRLIARSAKEAKLLATAARASARGRGAKAKLKAAHKLEQLASRCGKVAEQIDRRVRGLKVTDRLVSIADPDARPIRKGKLGKPTEFGCLAQICEITENTRKGARGFIVPAGHELGNPSENTLLPQTAAELDRAGIRPREIVADGGFLPGPTKYAFRDLADGQIHLANQHQPGSRRTRKRRARYRTGIEGRISHLKRRYRLRRSRLKGHNGMQIWTGGTIHLRRFCRISLTERVPDESTVRNLTRRIGAETVAELTRSLIVKATRGKRFRPRAVRVDSTVIEADIKHPTDLGLAGHGVRALAREGRKLARLVGEQRSRVRDCSRALGRKLRGIARTIRWRSGEAKAEVLKLTKETGELLELSAK